MTVLNFTITLITSFIVVNAIVFGIVYLVRWRHPRLFDNTDMAIMKEEVMEEKKNYYIQIWFVLKNNSSPQSFNSVDSYTKEMAELEKKRFIDTLHKAMIEDAIMVLADNHIIRGAEIAWCIANVKEL